jgi:hypothetical protein
MQRRWSRSNCKLLDTAAVRHERRRDKDRGDGGWGLRQDEMVASGDELAHLFCFTISWVQRVCGAGANDVSGAAAGDPTHIRTTRQRKWASAAAPHCAANFMWD